jgi:anti-sigma regulatory factor (Ser/Thr protein kinase)
MTLAVQDLSCEASAPHQARRWTIELLRSQLGDDPDAAELLGDAVLCVSELVTNAVAAGCSTLSLALSVDDQAVRVSVHDDAPGQPTPREAGPGDRSGRGLRLVEAVSRRWGVDALGRGKAVWAELSRSASGRRTIPAFHPAG